jgi:hypothetical protein
MNKQGKGGATAAGRERGHALAPLLVSREIENPNHNDNGGEAGAPAPLSPQGSGNSNGNNDNKNNDNNKNNNKNGDTLDMKHPATYPKTMSQSSVSFNAGRNTPLN